MKYLINVTLSLVISILVYFALSSINKEKYGYVDPAKLFESYKMTAELKRDFENISTEKRKPLDTLVSYIEKANSQIIKVDDNELQKVKKYFMSKSEMTNSELEKLSETYNQKIWKRINENVTQFGKENSFKILFDANGQGAIMYGEKNFDFTDKAIEYCNKKYEGK